MARRTIKTLDGQVFSDSCSRFENQKGYILYQKGLFKTVRINKRGIISDDISGLSALVLMALVIFLMVALAIGLLLLNRRLENSEGQRNANLAAEPPLVVIASKKSSRYYLPECPEYLLVKLEHKVSFDSEQRAYEAGYRKSRNCPR